MNTKKIQHSGIDKKSSMLETGIAKTGQKTNVAWSQTPEGLQLR